MSSIVTSNGFNRISWATFKNVRKYEFLKMNQMFNLLASECGIVMHEVSRNNRNVFPAELAQLIPQNFSQQISLLIPGSRFLPGILMGNPLEGFPAIIIKRLMNFKLGKTLQIKLACSLSVHHQEQLSISQVNPKLGKKSNLFDPTKTCLPSFNC